MKVGITMEEGDDLDMHEFARLITFVAQPCYDATIFIIQGDKVSAFKPPVASAAAEPTTTHSA